ncbi:penicillin-binding protein 2 [Bermanella marisrubri]|uniref:Peptidoglycan D,D-transpeptidase FtsI n=1 Tax=Bermanella marisrubri TaxID=207949 RepID=Q1MYB4_9GAMM|nr:penicillin-binding transpeptidase domain-containing protein [Bermanella marisrubri]EAT10953.1 penicillin-binding protein 2 [Oceanobacter sp. RED65] [Bermanella marisrubri]QIZ85101.1 penicillin-binding protein 2 [Bermanella marisrubri]
MSNKNQYANSQGARAWRHYLVMTLGLLLFVVLAGRLVQLQTFEQDFLQSEGEKRTVRDQLIHAYRGMIVDRNNEPLAVSTPVKSIWINPKQFLQDSKDIEGDLRQLAFHLSQSFWQLKNRVLLNKQKEFMYLERQQTPLLAKAIQALELPGVGVQQEFKRFYPAGEVASHVVGFTNIDESGIEGVELAFNDYLEGTPGVGRIVKDRLGRLVKDLGVVEPAQAGKELVLSLDLRLQYQAYRELKASVTQHGAKAGSLIMVDVKTGEILALVNQPAFNPNNRVELVADSVRNRVATDIFEPGSTVKPFTVAAALSNGIVQTESIVNTHPGFMRLKGKTIRDHRDYGRLDITGILTKSSNIGVSKLALEMGGNALWQFYQSLGLGQPVGLGLPGEQGGKISIRGAHWDNLQTATMSFGYGLAVTPLQLAQAYQVLANGGIKMPLTLVKQNKVRGERIISNKVANDVVAMLETVVGPKGTARRARVDGYRVAGKTGTVHKVGAQGYKDESYLSLFAGIAPADNPRIATIIVVDEPAGREYYGGEVAAPVFSRVAQASLRLLNIAPNVFSEKALAQNAIGRGHD